MNSNLIPPIFQPWNLAMALLAFVWFMTVALSLHRASRYLAQRHLWVRFAAHTADFVKTHRAGRPLRAPGHSLLTELLGAVRCDSRHRARDAFHSQVLVPSRSPDIWNDRAMEIVCRVAPLLGFIGTLVGIVTAFNELASAQNSVTVKDLAIPISMAMITTIHGAACAIVCISVRSLCPLRSLHASADSQFLAAWRTLAGLRTAALPSPQLRQPGAERAGSRHQLPRAPQLSRKEEQPHDWQI